MPRQRYTTEQIINKLRRAEVLLSQGRSIREVWPRNSRSRITPTTAGIKITAGSTTSRENSSLGYKPSAPSSRVSVLTPLAVAETR